MKPGFDPLLQAYGGMMSVTGRPEDPPTFCGASINDKATGMFCTIGALAALRMRDKTGKGCLVDTSLFNSAVHWVEGQVNSLPGERRGAQATWHRRLGDRALPDLRHCRPAGLPGPGNDRLWARCAQVLGRPEWATDPRYAKSAARVANKTELLPMIAAAMRRKTRADWLEAFEKAGVPCSPVNDIGELAGTEQLAAADLVHQLPARDGEGRPARGRPADLVRPQAPPLRPSGAEARRAYGRSVGKPAGALRWAAITRRVASSAPRGACVNRRRSPSRSA